MVRTDIKVGVNNREVCTFLQKKQVRNAIINLMIANSRYIRAEQIHNLDSRNASELRINDRTTKHIPGNRIEHISFFRSHLIDIAAQSSHTANELAVNFFREKISMHIIRVQQCQLL